MDLTYYQEVYVIQHEPFARIFKLVDSLYQCLYLFQAAAENSPHDKFRKLAGEIRQQLDNYGFELQTELRRLGVNEPRLLTPAPALTPSEPTDERCELALQSAVAQ